jgi:Leucine-rich repeat (LRR) protein
MQKNRSLPILLFSLILLLTFWVEPAHAQSDKCPRIYREGETLRTDPAQSYQWYKNGEIIPSATEETYTPTGRSANYAVQVEGKASTSFAFALGQVNLIGQAFDEHLRPVANARIAVGSQTTQSDAQGRFQLGPISASTTILLRGEKAGHWTAQRRITPTGRQTHVQIMLRSQPFEHELSAERGGTISRGAFFLTLQPNGVLDANNQPYTGVVKIALNGGRPDDPHFGWMMPGGDFMAQDAQGRERILQSYGFLSAHLQTPSGQPLKLDPSIGAQLRFVMPTDMVSGAPDSMPLWHFDEAAGIWKEEGYTHREGAAYVGTVRHFSSWNCDWPGPWCMLRGKTVDCKGRPVAGAPLRLGQQIINSDSAGGYSGRVPATLRFDIQAMNGIGKITVGPFVEGSENEVEDLMDGISIFGYGVIDTSQTMAISIYETKGSVEYSIDSGATYQSSNRFVTQIDSSYQVFVRDSLDCPTSVNYARLGVKAACQVLDSVTLSQATQYYSIEQALASEETVYRLWLNWNNFGNYFPVIILSAFPCLQELGLGSNQLRNVSESIGYLNQLQMLRLSANELSSLPESIGNLTQLQRLGLDGNQLSSLPESIANLTQLLRLDLSYNKLSSLPESIGNLTQLDSLYINGNPLTSLPQSIGNLTRLVRLELYGNQLSGLPESIGNLSQLQELGLDGNQLSSLPEYIGSLTQLQRLGLNNNQLNSLPESIGNLTQLESLSLYNNRLAALPESIGNLTELKEIRMNSNQLLNLPESIGNLTQLQGLGLDSNQLRSLPESFGDLSNLQKIDLRVNQLRSLPESFGNLSQLKELYVSNNQLNRLSDSFSNLSRLTFLDLAGNQLISLPESFGNLSQLKELNMSRNQLNRLPDSFGNLSQLESLGLFNNQLTSLPESIANLTNLRFLNLQNNPIPPAEQERIRRLLPNCLVTF